MRKLLSANFSRLKKDKVFWLCMSAISIYAAVYIFNWCRMAVGNSDESGYYCIDKCFFHFGPTIGIFCALFCSMFFGTEYSDGTIRNKIIVGHTRTSIYLANLLTSYAVTLIFVAIWSAVSLTGIPTLGKLQMSNSQFLLGFLITIMFSTAICSVIMFVCMLSSNKAATAVSSLLLVLALIVIASMVYNILCEPEMSSGAHMTLNGIEMSEPKPNPNYVGGTLRKVYEFICDFLPTGQGIRMAQFDIISPVRMLVSSAFIMVLTTLTGIFTFKRKNLK